MLNDTLYFWNLNYNMTIVISTPLLILYTSTTPLNKLYSHFYLSFIQFSSDKKKHSLLIFFLSNYLQNTLPFSFSPNLILFQKKKKYTSLLYKHHFFYNKWIITVLIGEDRCIYRTNIWQVKVLKVLLCWNFQSLTLNYTVKGWCGLFWDWHM